MDGNNESMPDNLTPVQRSFAMSRVKGKDTKPEISLRKALHRLGLRYRIHVKSLPGKPDIVFPKERIAIFVDGDFWHGWNYSRWKDSLPSEFWKEKIAINRMRDRRNFARLRRRGWRVIRFWEHQIDSNVHDCARKVSVAISIVTPAE